MSNRQLIVLSGEAGAGKDSVADILVDQYGYEKFSLSEEMKIFCQRVFGWSDEQLWGPSQFRNAPDPKWARPCPYCKGTGRIRVMRRRDCYTCEGRGEINDNSPRRVLQLLGDEWARQMIHPDIWTMSVRTLLETKLTSNTKIVVNDARFDNDRKNLALWLDATVVDVQTSRNKQNKLSELWRKHGSENSRSSTEVFHYVINNDEEWPFPSLASKVAEMLTSS